MKTGRGHRGFGLVEYLIVAATVTTIVAGLLFYAGRHTERMDTSTGTTATLSSGVSNHASHLDSAVPGAKSQDESPTVELAQPSTS